MRLYIAGSAGVTVIPPGTTQMAVAFQYDEIIEPLFFKLNSRANASEAGAYDELVELGGVHGVKIAM